MAHSYRKVLDDRGGLVYEKAHDNGETTTIQADKVGTQETGGTSWLVNVTDPNGSERIGRFETKQAARSRMTAWMGNHPKGVRGPGGAMGAIGAMEDATNSIFTGGGRF